MMCVFNAVTGKTISIMGSVSLLYYMSVARLKTVVSVQSGLPVSTFRFSTSTGVELYDCNQLRDYAIKVGMLLLSYFAKTFLKILILIINVIISQKTRFNIISWFLNHYIASYYKVYCLGCSYSFFVL